MDTPLTCDMYINSVPVTSDKSDGISNRSADHIQSSVFCLGEEYVIIGENMLFFIKYGIHGNIFLPHADIIEQAHFWQ